MRRCDLDENNNSGNREAVDPAEKVNSALSRLRDELIEARFAYETGDDAGRLGAILAVAAATNLLTEMGISAELREPLISLAVALSDAQRGLYNAMFEPDTDARTSSLLIAQSDAQAQAAAAMELLMRGTPTYPRLNREFAAKKVVLAVRKWKLDLHLKQRSLTWRTIAGWRDKMKSNLPSDPAVQIFRKIIRNFENENIDPHEAANRLLAFPALAKTIRDAQNSD